MCKKTHFYGGLGDVATRRLVGLPWDLMHFVWLIFREIQIFFSWWMTGDFSRNV